ncbi:MAG: hypothetical protein J1F17_00960 [Oscillospiraceae bacterium]|nr:hypothetical protein [Oscillospiraceae bacterium]
MKEKLSKLKNDKNLIRIIFIIGIAGILLIFCSTLFDSEKTEDIDSFSVEEYRSLEENRIKEMVESIQGVGKARVMVTMENSVEQVYSNDNKVKEIEPAIRGVLVICSGADNPVIKETVLESITKALNLSSDKVCITKLKEE